MFKPWLAASLSVLIVSSLAQSTDPAAQSPASAAKPAEQAPNPIPEDAINKPNPVKATPESMAKAKRTYGFDCAMCHGKDGSGDGDLAKDMKLKLDDYRDPAILKDKKDGELFYIIKNGKGQMPEEGNRAKTDDIWNLVLYLRSFSGKKS